MNINDPAVVALLAWLRMQRNAIADIPIIGIGSDVRQLRPNLMEAAAKSTTAELLVNALRRVIQKRSATGD